MLDSFFNSTYLEHVGCKASVKTIRFQSPCLRPHTTVSQCICLKLYWLSYYLSTPLHPKPALPPKFSLSLNDITVPTYPNQKSQSSSTPPFLSQLLHLHLPNIHSVSLKIYIKIYLKMLSYYRNYHTEQRK